MLWYQCYIFNDLNVMGAPGMKYFNLEIQTSYFDLFSLFGNEAKYLGD